MGWTRQMETAADMLDRIVAMLLSLASLAERAACVPQARRRTVLAILRNAAIFTRDAFDVSADSAAERYFAPATSESRTGDSPEDALALAMSFRFLALIVANMNAQHRFLRGQFTFFSAGARLGPAMPSCGKK